MQSGINTTIISALKITAESIAEAGLCGYIIFNEASGGYVATKSRWYNSEIFARSLTTLNVCQRPLVIIICLPT